MPWAPDLTWRTRSGTSTVCLFSVRGALSLFGATWLGIPVSTTHTITGAIVGVGAARRASAVRWG
ncbi:inorganic phosphate transporter, partial [Roseomonas indoligenes]|uniref:inorganic phosphate transporter n=1 Tax=Roseomonas indoligenes TaxID=2820811 RepID=UPI003D80A99F